MPGTTVFPVKGEVLCLELSIYCCDIVCIGSVCGMWCAHDMSLFILFLCQVKLVVS